MQTGLSGFKELLREFRRLALWGAGGSAVPFAAHLVSLSPPWPQGIVAVTAIFELISLVFVYQFVKFKRKRIVDRILVVGAAAMVVVGGGYLVAVSLYVYQTPHTKERFVKGYVCTADAQMVFKDKCPVLSTDDIATANYEAESLWTARSIAIVRVSLVALWLVAFTALSVVIGSFIVFQTQISLSQSSGNRRPSFRAER